MITLDINSSDEEISQVYSLTSGNIFHVSNNYEGEWDTIIHKIFENKPDGWDAVPIKAGTELYSLYGSEKLVVL